MPQRKRPRWGQGLPPRSRGQGHAHCLWGPAPGTAPHLDSHAGAPAKVSLHKAQAPSSLRKQAARSAACSNCQHLRLRRHCAGTSRSPHVSPRVPTPLEGPRAVGAAIIVGTCRASDTRKGTGGCWISTEEQQGDAGSCCSRRRCPGSRQTDNSCWHLAGLRVKRLLAQGQEVVAAP